MYSVAISDIVKNQSDKKISKSAKAEIIKAINNKLVNDPMVFSKPLQYNFVGLRSFRVGDYRVIIKVNEESKTIEIYDIGHRKDIYN